MKWKKNVMVVFSMYAGTLKEQFTQKEKKKKK